MKGMPAGCRTGRPEVGKSAALPPTAMTLSLTNSWAHCLEATGEPIALQEMTCTGLLPANPPWALI
jgi:hypothetical protein